MKSLDIRYINEDEYIKWDKFVDNSSEGNIFNKTKWLKTVSNNFKILAAFENDTIIGGIALPVDYKKFYRNPKLTPQLGILIFKKDDGQKYASYVGKQIEIINELIKKLPKCYLFDYNFSYKFSNMLPFIWNNYNVSVRYTYMIEDLSDINKIYNSFLENVKRSIKKATKSNIKVCTNYGVEEFFNINKLTYERQKMEIPYTLDFLKNIDNAMEKNRKIFIAQNEEGKLIAGVYLIYDEKCAYYLMGGADPKYRNIGAQDLLIWEAIKFSSTASKCFDFEGSMVPNIERVFREFGGKQTVIYNVSKSNKAGQAIYSFAKANKNIIRKFINI